MADGLAAWLLERIAEDERAAQAAAAAGAAWGSPNTSNGRHWTVDVHDDRGAGSAYVTGETREPVWDIDENAWTTTATATHIATWDPARVLAECDVKRALVDACATPAHDDWDANDHEHLAWSVLVKLASVYSDRPGYREEWRS